MYALHTSYTEQVMPNTTIDHLDANPYDQGLWNLANLCKSHNSRLGATGAQAITE